MTTSEFLHDILPTEGYYCLARPVPYKETTVFKHFVTADIAELTATALEWDAAGHDVYYAMASLKEPRVFDPKKGESGGWRVRTKANIAAIRSVFLELDVLKPSEISTASDDEKERKYLSREEGLAATKSFFATIGWPLPTVVDSGWGFHLYWPLVDAVEPSRFEVLAKKAKVVAKRLGYKLDPACTDMSRVFRVPGTHNHKVKDDAKLVAVRRAAAQRVEFDTLMQALDDYIDEHNINAGDITERAYLPDYLNFGESNTSDMLNEPMQLAPIVEKCGAIREFIDAGADVSYHYWMHSMQVIRFCENGRELCHSISSNAESYDAGATDKLLDSFEEKDIPPTLCDTFASACSACSSCPYRGKVRSPAAFGREGKAAAEVVHVAMLAATGQMPPAPWPFRFTPGKGVEMEVADKTGTSEWVNIFEYDMRPVKRVYSEQSQREVTLWETNNPADGFIRIEMPAAALYDKRMFQSTLADSGVYCDLLNVDNLRRYMVTYTQSLQKIFRKEILYARMGWRDNSRRFVYAGHVYEDATIRQCEVEQHGRVAEAITSSGNLEAWKSIMAFFDHPSFAGHQLAIGTAFGSILMPFTGLSGGIINMVGDSGEGKSTVQKIVNSVWGHPHKLMMPAESRSSTYNAKISFINQMHNLPICAEEITGATPEELGALAYAITQGSEKWRADITGKIKESLGGWCTTMLCSSNMPIHDRLHNTDGAEAKALRVFEYRLNRVDVHTKSEFREGVDLPLMEHYGLAGAEYLRYIVANAAEVKQQVADKLSQIDQVYSMKPEERVWSAVIATNLVGLTIAKKLGLVNFDVAKIAVRAEVYIQKMRSSVMDIATNAADSIANFLSESIASTLVVDTQKAATYIIHTPTRSLDVRYDIGKNEVYITVSKLRNWCATVGVSYSKLLDELDSIRVLKGKTGRMRLGAGSDLPSAQTRVISIDAGAPSFSGALQAVATPLKSIGVNV